MQSSFVKLGDDLFVDVNKVTHVLDDGDGCFIYFDGFFHDGLRVQGVSFHDVIAAIGDANARLMEQKKCG